eukprot:gb/GEZN01004221.1/.p1 GENE.gb/GEZN01004221.1/~~gb/GEZN01004221.1/.p1  ORF type:complete len:598 (+),score=126.25 gb/GEZN01004221.1/:25-1794(+)
MSVRFFAPARSRALVHSVPTICRRGFVLRNRDFACGALESHRPKWVRRASSMAVKEEQAQFEVKIGLEVHAQITTQSKLFSGAATGFMSPPNAQVAFFDAALPGTLPVLNRSCVDQAIRTGLAVGGKVNLRSSFVRKHYFYCDLPHGYQITQTSEPIVSGGSITIMPNDEASGDNTASLQKRVRINQIQLEMDSGKSIHDLDPTRTHVDLNRAGVALMEIVTEPDMSSAQEANAFVRQLTAILRRVGSCECLFEQGGMRCDVNVSLHRPGSTVWGERVEIKNMTGLRAMLRAIAYEIERQTAMILAGEPVRRQTRGFDGSTGTTFPLRDKESLLDYRFFPEPDLPDLVLTPKYVQQMQQTLPELPEALVTRYVNKYGLSYYAASTLVAEQGGPEYFEAMLRHGKQRDPVKCVNWMLSDLQGHLNMIPNERLGGRYPTFAESPVSPAQLGDLVDMVETGEISNRAAKEVLQLLVQQAKEQSKQQAEARTSSSDSPPVKNVRQLVEAQGLTQVSDSDQIAELCQDVLRQNPDEVQKYHATHEGKKKKLMRHFVGQVMKLSQGKANPQVTSSILTQKLEQQFAESQRTSEAK